MDEIHFHANLNLHPCERKLKVRTRENIRVCYLVYLLGECLSKDQREEWKEAILRQLDIETSYYKSKYKEPVSDFPSDSNRKFAKEMEKIFWLQVIFREILRHNHLYHSKFISPLFVTGWYLDR